MSKGMQFWFRNPRLVRFMVPNEIWELSLTAPEFVIICYIHTERRGSSCFFTLPDRIFALDLKPSEFMVYAHLLLCEDRREHVSCASYRAIRGATHLSKGTVVKAVAVLEEKGLIEKMRRSWIDSQGMKWNAANAYRIHSFDSVIRNLREKEEERIHEQIKWNKLMRKLNATAERYENFEWEEAKAG